MPDPFTRLDRLLRERHPELSWRQIRDAIEQGQVTVDSRVQHDPAHAVAADADVTLDRNRPAQRRIRAPFEILHEDDDILVIDKPAGVLTIPTSPELADVEDSILRRAREYVALKQRRGGYVGMLHRLDRDTSGALAIALSNEAHAAGREMFRRHDFDRRYLALVQGAPARERGTIDSRISSEYRAGRRAIVGAHAPGLDARTDYIVRERFAHASLIELRLHTGRQHQIRLHLEQLGHPLLGERVYDKPGLSPRPKGLSNRQMLHASTLAFPHPITGARISVEAPLPDDFERLLRTLRQNPRT